MRDTVAGGDGTRASAKPGSRPRLILIGTAQVAVTGGLLALIVARWGAAPFVHAVAGVPVWAWVFGLLLGSLGVVAQALRWRLVAREQGIRVSVGSAVARCWQAAFLNSVLPGGLAGDALRAADDSTDATVNTGKRALGRGFAAVAAERLAGTAVVFLAAAIALVGRAPIIAAVCVAIAGVAIAVAWRWIRVLPASRIVAVVVLSTLGWACFAGLFVLLVVAGAPTVPLSHAPGLAAVAVAGMSVPVGVGGWGTRETAAGWVFTLLGLDAGLGVAVSVAYGLVALASTLPGGLVLVARAAPRLRAARAASTRRRGRTVESAQNGE